MPRYWLFKSEPDCFSIDDLARAPGATTRWDGIRNSEARNFLRDSMALGDLGFFYHSSSDPSEIVGIVAVVRAAYPDPTAFDSKDPHFDRKSDRERPTWFAVDLKFVEKLPRGVSLDEVKGDAKLAQMALVKRGRLSVSPVAPAEWKRVLQLSRGGARAVARATTRTAKGRRRSAAAAE